MINIKQQKNFFGAKGEGTPRSDHVSQDPLTPHRTLLKLKRTLSHTKILQKTKFMFSS